MAPMPSSKPGRERPAAFVDECSPSPALASSVIDRFCQSNYLRLMATLNVSLPDAMRAFVDGEVASGDYGTASAYIQQLIRRDKRRAEVRQLLLDGIASGSAGAYDDAFRARMRERAAGQTA